MTLENMTVHDVAAIDSAVTSLQAMMKEGLSDKEKLLEEATKLQTNCGLAAKDRVPILFFAIVCEQPTTTITEFISVLSGLTESKDAQLEVLQCLEETVVRCEQSKQDTALTLIPLVLKMLYDEDVVDEELILQWFDGSVKIKHTRSVVPEETVAAIRKHAQPIIDWLKEADSEEESGEE